VGGPEDPAEHAVASRREVEVLRGEEGVLDHTLVHRRVGKAGMSWRSRHEVGVRHIQSSQIKKVLIRLSRATRKGSRYLEERAGFDSATSTLISATTRRAVSQCWSYDNFINHGMNEIFGKRAFSLWIMEKGLKTMERFSIIGP
jgi:hypothetical protein